MTRIGIVFSAVLVLVLSTCRSAHAQDGPSTPTRLEPLSASGQARRPVVVLPGPVERATRYSDGREQLFESQVVVRPMCGSNLQNVRRDDLQRLAGAMLEPAQQEDVRVISPGRVLRGAGLNVVFNLSGGFPAGADTALETAATYIESQFSDNVTVTINTSFANLGGGVIGATGSFFLSVNWPIVRDGLINGKDSDDTIQDWIPMGETIPVRYVGTSSTVTDENRVFVSRANYRATIGVTFGSDATMQFNSNFNFDFDPSNGVPFFQTDFQSVVIHEVAHAMGFTSGVDFRVNDMEMLDVYRFQRTDGTGDFNPDTLAEFQTTARLVDLNTPNDDHNVDVISVEYRMEDGSPWQASHFRTTVAALLDPNLAAGQTFFPNFYRTPDLTMLDAIGWDFPAVPVDNTPPTPDPMSFAVAPAPTGLNAVAMTATTATDADTPPVEYSFDETTGAPGGTDSGWQSATTYTDTGLSANTAYSYRVAARDSAATPNQTAFSPAADTATLIETPTGIAFGTVTHDSVELVATGSFSNLTTGLSGLFFDSTTAGGDGGLNVWQQGTMTTATGLQPNTSYTFRVKARNQLGVETVFGPENTIVTPHLPADCNGDNVLDLAGDGPCFVDALLGFDTVPPGGIERSNVNGDLSTDANDIQVFVECLISGCP